MLVSRPHVGAGPWETQGWEMGRHESLQPLYDFKDSGDGLGSDFWPWGGN